MFLSRKARIFPLFVTIKVDFISIFGKLSLDLIIHLIAERTVSETFLKGSCY